MRDDAAIGELFDMIGARMAVMAQLGAGDDDIVLIRARLAPRAAVPLHSHRDVECFYVLDGAIEVFLAGEAPGWHAVEAGHGFTVPGDVKHALRVIGDRPVDAVVATTRRLARFFREAGKPAAPDTPPGPPQPADITRVIETSGRYGYWLASPEESARVTGG